MPGVTGFSASAVTRASAARLGVQFAPPSVLLKTRPSAVPAYRVLGVSGSIANAWTAGKPGESLEAAAEFARRVARAVRGSVACRHENDAGIVASNSTFLGACPRAVSLPSLASTRKQAMLSCPQLEQYKSQTRAKLLNSPVADPAGFAHRLQGAFRWMWKRWCAC